MTTVLIKHGRLDTRELHLVTDFRMDNIIQFNEEYHSGFIKAKLCYVLYGIDYAEVVVPVMYYRACAPEAFFTEVIDVYKTTEPDLDTVKHVIDEIIAGSKHMEEDGSIIFAFPDAIAHARRLVLEYAILITRSYHFFDVIDKDWISLDMLTNILSRAENTDEMSTIAPLWTLEKVCRMDTYVFRLAANMVATGCTWPKSARNVRALMSYLNRIKYSPAGTKIRVLEDDSFSLTELFMIRRVYEMMVMRKIPIDDLASAGSLFNCVLNQNSVIPRSIYKANGATSGSWVDHVGQRLPGGPGQPKFRRVYYHSHICPASKKTKANKDKIIPRGTSNDGTAYELVIHDGKRKQINEGTVLGLCERLSEITGDLYTSRTQKLHLLERRDRFLLDPYNKVFDDPLTPLTVQALVMARVTSLIGSRACMYQDIAEIPEEKPEQTEHDLLTFPPVEDEHYELNQRAFHNFSKDYLIWLWTQQRIYAPQNSS